MQLRFNTARIEQLQAQQREATERNVDEHRATACKVASNEDRDASRGQKNPRRREREY